MNFPSRSLTHFIWIASLFLAFFIIGKFSLTVDTISFKKLTELSDTVTTHAPYSYSSASPVEAGLLIHYNGYSGTRLTLDARSCFSNIIGINGEFYKLYPKLESICFPVTIDLRDMLKVGDNILTIDQRGIGLQRSMTASSPMWGPHPVKILCLLYIMGASTWLIWNALARRGFSAMSCFMFVIAGYFYSLCLYKIPTFAFPQDLDKHIAYLAYIQEHFFTPYHYTGEESWHPPTYYWVSILAMKFAQFTNTLSGWDALRMFSVLCYLCMIYWGMRTFQLFLKGRALYLASALLIFWPSGIANVIRINNDVLLYPFYAAAIFYVLSWCKMHQTHMLRRALICCALAFTIKTSALIPTGIVCASLLSQRIWGYVRWRDIFNRHTLGGWIALGAGLIYTNGKSLYLHWTDKVGDVHTLGPKGIYIAKWEDFFSTNWSSIIHEPLNFTLGNLPIWNRTIKELLFDSGAWKNVGNPQLISSSFLIMMAYALIFFCWGIWHGRKTHLPVLAGLIVPFTASCIFTLLSQMPSGMNFHYIHPTLIIILLVFFLAAEEAKRRKYTFFYLTGHALAIQMAAYIGWFIIAQWF